jgi:hypothetical protein
MPAECNLAGVAGTACSLCTRLRPGLAGAQARCEGGEESPLSQGPQPL